MIVNSTLIQNIPLFKIITPFLADLPTPQGTISSVFLEGTVGSGENISFIARNTTNPSQSFFIKKIQYKPLENVWTQSMLPFPQTTNPASAGLRWTQDSVGNMWIIQNVLRGGSAGNGFTTNIFYVSSDLQTIRRIYNGTQYSFLDIQLSPAGMFALASFQSPVPGSTVFGIVNWPQPPLDSSAPFSWLPGTQMSSPIQAFLFPQDLSLNLFIVGQGPVLDFLSLNSTTNRWQRYRSLPLNSTGQVLQIITGLQANTLYYITQKALVQLVFRIDAIVQTTLLSFPSSSPFSFRSVGIGRAEQSFFSTTSTPSSTQTESVSITGSPSSSITGSPSNTISASNSLSESPSSSITESPSQTISDSISETPSSTMSDSITGSPSQSQSQSSTMSNSISGNPNPSPSPSSTITGSQISINSSASSSTSASANITSNNSYGASGSFDSSIGLGIGFGLVLPILLIGAAVYLVKRRSIKRKTIKNRRPRDIELKPIGTPNVFHKVAFDANTVSNWGQQHNRVSGKKQVFPPTHSWQT